MPLLLLLIRIGPPWLSLVVGAVAAVGVVELGGMAWQRGGRPLTLFAVLWALAFVANGHFVAEGRSSGDITLPIVGIGLLLSLIWLLWRRREHEALADWGYTVASALYAGWLLSYAPLLRGLEQGWQWLYLALLATFATDTSAFFVGKAFGKRPLAPSISPGKTWEGALGGFLGGVAASGLLASLLGIDMAIWQSLVLGALVGVLGQLGDLAESLLKRTSGVKDAGGVIPGHGGVLDRLDSLVFNLVGVYYFAVWVVE